MAAYVVKWEIEVEADSPEEAVAEAYNMFPHPGSDSTAKYFDVAPEPEADDPNTVWESVKLDDVGR